MLKEKILASKSIRGKDKRIEKGSGGRDKLISILLFYNGGGISSSKNFTLFLH